MSATATRWEVRCNWATLDCDQPPVVVEARSLAEVRSALRARGWRCGEWKEWSGRGHLDMCPRCVAFAMREIQASR